MFVIRQNRNRQWVGHCEDRFGGGAITAQIIKNDGQTRGIGVDGLALSRNRATREADFNRVGRARTASKSDRGYIGLIAARAGLKLVALRNDIERTQEPRGLSISLGVAVRGE